MEQLLSNKNRLPYYSDYLGSFSGIYSPLSTSIDSSQREKFQNGLMNG